MANPSDGLILVGLLMEGGFMRMVIDYCAVNKVLKGISCLTNR
jgi:hypothetical protein